MSSITKCQNPGGPGGPTYGGAPGLIPNPDFFKAIDLCTYIVVKLAGTECLGENNSKTKMHQTMHF